MSLIQDASRELWRKLPVQLVTLKLKSGVEEVGQFQVVPKTSPVETKRTFKNRNRNHRCFHL